VKDEEKKTKGRIGEDLHGVANFHRYHPGINLQWEGKPPKGGWTQARFEPGLPE